MPSVSASRRHLSWVRLASSPRRCSRRVPAPRRPSGLRSTTVASALGFHTGSWANRAVTTSNTADRAMARLRLSSAATDSRSSQCTSSTIRTWGRVRARASTRSRMLSSMRRRRRCGSSCAHSSSSGGASPRIARSAGQSGSRPGQKRLKKQRSLAAAVSSSSRSSKPAQSRSMSAIGRYGVERVSRSAPVTWTSTSAFSSVLRNS